MGLKEVYFLPTNYQQNMKLFYKWLTGLHHHSVEPMVPNNAFTVVTLPALCDEGLISCQTSSLWNSTDALLYPFRPSRWSKLFFWFLCLYSSAWILEPKVSEALCSVAPIGPTIYDCILPNLVLSLSCRCTYALLVCLMFILHSFD